MTILIEPIFGPHAAIAGASGSRPAVGDLTTPASGVPYRRLTDITSYKAWLDERPGGDFHVPKNSTAALLAVWAGIPGSPTSGLWVEYSSFPCANGKWLICDGPAGYVAYTLSDGVCHGTLPLDTFNAIQNSHEPRLHPTNEDLVLYHVANTFKSIDLRTMVSTTIGTFTKSGGFASTHGGQEGNYSDDLKWGTWFTDGSLGIIDLLAGIVLPGTYTPPGGSLLSNDGIKMVPDGSAVLYNVETDHDNNSGALFRTVDLAANIVNRIPILSPSVAGVRSTGHPDFFLGADGKWYGFVRDSRADEVGYYSLETGAWTRICHMGDLSPRFNYAEYPTTTRIPGLPGWMMFSTEGTVNLADRPELPAEWIQNEFILIECIPESSGPRVIRIGTDTTEYQDGDPGAYFSQPNITLSHDGRSLYCGSNWNGTNNQEIMRFEIPANLLGDPSMVTNGPLTEFDPGVVVHGDTPYNLIGTETFLGVADELPAAQLPSLSPGIATPPANVVLANLSHRFNFLSGKSTSPGTPASNPLTIAVARVTTNPTAQETLTGDTLHSDQSVTSGAITFGDGVHSTQITMPVAAFDGTLRPLSEGAFENVDVSFQDFYPNGAHIFLWVFMVGNAADIIPAGALGIRLNVATDAAGTGQVNQLLTTTNIDAIPANIWTPIHFLNPMQAVNPLHLYLFGDTFSGTPGVRVYLTGTFAGPLTGSGGNIVLRFANARFTTVTSIGTLSRDRVQAPFRFDKCEDPAGSSYDTAAVGDDFEVGILGDVDRKQLYLGRECRFTCPMLDPASGCTTDGQMTGPLFFGDRDGFFNLCLDDRLLTWGCPVNIFVLEVDAANLGDASTVGITSNADLVDADGGSLLAGLIVAKVTPGTNGAEPVIEFRRITTNTATLLTIEVLNNVGWEHNAVAGDLLIIGPLPMLLHFQELRRQTPAVARVATLDLELAPNDLADNSDALPAFDGLLRWDVYTASARRNVADMTAPESTQLVQLERLERGRGILRLTSTSSKALAHRLMVIPPQTGAVKLTNVLVGERQRAGEKGR